MTHLYAELRAASDAAILAMQHAARHARDAHARAELLRHMHTTAAQPGADVNSVTREWLDAWGMSDWPDVRAEAARFTTAVLAYASGTDQADQALRAALAGLDSVLATQGTTLAEQMAWRSRCAHGWWRDVAPEPPGMPFWTKGCPPDCL